MKPRTELSLWRLPMTALAFLAAAGLAGEAALADTLHVTDDAYVYQSGAKAKKKFGKAQTLIVNSGGKGQAVFLKFDLSPVPSDTLIDQALLRLWIGKVKKPGHIDVYLVPAPVDPDPEWSEGNIKGTNAPDLSSLTPVTSFPVEPSDVNDFFTVDLTAEVQDWLTGLVANRGVALMAQEVDDIVSPVNVTFDSKENVKTSHQPELEVAVSIQGNAPVDTNAETECGTDEVLDGDGDCVLMSDITPDTSAVTLCEEDEVLDGDGLCVPIGDITPDTNAGTLCGAGEFLLGDGTCEATGSVTPDTNAATECGTGEVLDGDGFCVLISSITPDTNAQTECATGQVLDGDGNCVPMSSITPDTDTNAATLCPAGTFLNGDGTCDAAAAINPIPTGAVMAFALASCPGGWDDLVGGTGRYIVGATPGTLGNTVGTALNVAANENRPVGQHSHSMSSDGQHAHNFDDAVRDFSTLTHDLLGSVNVPHANNITTVNNGTDTEAAHTHTINATGSVAGTNAPYIQLLLCVKG